MLNKSKKQIFIVTGIFLFIVILITGIPYYIKYVAPYNRAIIKVDKENLSMRYFLARTRLANKDPMTMLQMLTNEQLIKLAAPGYGITANNLEIENALRIMAGNGNENLSESEYREWYRQQLNNSKLTNAQYRDMVGIKIIMTRLQKFLAGKVSDKAEQYHLHIIVLDAYDKAQDISGRLKKGENFAKIAAKESIDPKSKKSGGDLGWIPASISAFADQLSSMKLNEISEPIPYYKNKATGEKIDYKNPDAYYILKISGKENKKVSAEYLQVLKDNVLDIWLQEEINKHEIKYALDSNIYPWISKQLQKE